MGPLNGLTILLRALATYITRILGYIGLRDRTLSLRMLTVLQTTPGCVLIAVIAPNLVSDRPADLLALALTLLAATRLPLLLTVLIAVVSSGVFCHVFH